MIGKSANACFFFFESHQESVGSNDPLSTNNPFAQELWKMNPTYCFYGSYRAFSDRRWEQKPPASDKSQMLQQPHGSQTAEPVRMSAEDTRSRDN